MLNHVWRNTNSHCIICQIVSLKGGFYDNTLIIVKCSPNYIVHKSPNLASHTHYISHHQTLLSRFLHFEVMWFSYMGLRVSTQIAIEASRKRYWVMKVWLGPIKSGLETCLCLSSNSKGLPHYLHRAILHASQWHIPFASLTLNTFWPVPNPFSRLFVPNAS